VPGPRTAAPTLTELASDAPWRVDSRLLKIVYC